MPASAMLHQVGRPRTSHNGMSEAQHVLDSAAAALRKAAKRIAMQDDMICILSCVTAGVLEDTMESFFLSETAKYLFLLGANATGLPDFYVLTTEGHLLPPLPASAAAGAGLGSGAQIRGADLPACCRPKACCWRVDGRYAERSNPNAGSKQDTAGSGGHSTGTNDGASQSASGSSSSSSQGGSAGSSAGGSAGTPADSTSGDGSGVPAEAADGSDGSNASADVTGSAEAAASVPEACAELCRRQGAAQRRAAADRLQAALPLLRAAPDSMALLRCPCCLRCS
jgi:Glycosyl hydrolase family 47